MVAYEIQLPAQADSEDLTTGQVPGSINVDYISIRDLSSRHCRAESQNFHRPLSIGDGPESLFKPSLGRRTQRAGRRLCVIQDAGGSWYDDFLPMPWQPFYEHP